MDLRFESQNRVQYQTEVVESQPSLLGNPLLSILPFSDKRAARLGLKIDPLGTNYGTDAQPRLDLNRTTIIL
jgi:hypothetical protein